MVGIYKITSPSGKIYIGQSWDTDKRFNQYKRYSCTNQIKLYRSLKKHGSENHNYEVIHELPEDVQQIVLDVYEELYMSQYRDCGFRILNLKLGGSGGGKHCEETKQKLSVSAQNRVLSEEGRKRLREARKGNTNFGDRFLGLTHTEESKVKIGLSKLGIERSEDTKKRISESRTGKHYELNQGENNSQNKLSTSQVLEIRAKYIPYVYSLTMVAKEYGICFQTVSDIINRKIWTHI